MDVRSAGDADAVLVLLMMLLETRGGQRGIEDLWGKTQMITLCNSVY